MAESDSTLASERLAPAPPRARVLRVVYSPDEDAVGRTFPLDGRSAYVFGRAAEGRGRVSDGRMSRSHAAVRPEGDGRSYLVEDFGAKNGTYLHGKRLAKPARLLAGHVLAVGDTLLVVDQEPEPGTLPASPGASGEDAFELSGVSLVTEALRRSIATVAPTRQTVLMLGETGAGKEVAAAAIHRLSGRSRLVAVNCSGIPSDRAEAELYGWKKGAFTGAHADHDGYFVQAEGGTLFLDEIADLPAALQASLLRALQDGSIQPVGGTTRKVEVRILAATHKDLGTSAFRKDLFARLGDWVLHIPSLRERRADILPLWTVFTDRLAAGGRNRPLSPLFAEALLLHEWPMNVRELEKLAGVQWVLTQGEDRFEADHLPQHLRALLTDRADDDTPEPVSDPAEATVSPDDDDGGLRPPLDLLESELAKHQGNLQKTAKANGWHRTQLYRWVRALGIDVERYRGKP